jgi:hypothetical protein
MDPIEQARKCIRMAQSLLKHSTRVRELAERRALIDAIYNMEAAISLTWSRLERLDSELRNRGIVVEAADQEVR